MTNRAPLCIQKDSRTIHNGSVYVFCGLFMLQLAPRLPLSPGIHLPKSSYPIGDWTPHRAMYCRLVETYRSPVGCPLVSLLDPVT